MITRLSLRRMVRKLIADPKGFSSVVGTIFMVLVVMVLSSGVFLWTLSQNTLYNQNVIESKQGELDRLNEMVTATNANYSVSENTVIVSVKLTNEGSVTAQLVRFWIEAERQDELIGYSFIDNLTVALNPGDTENLQIEVTISGVSSEDNFTSWFVTARGNLVSVRRFDLFDVLGELIALGGVGPMIYSFYDFRYYTYSTATKLYNYPEGIQSFEVPNDTDVAFGIRLTNLDAYKRSMTITAYTHLWVTSDSASMNQWKRFYVVDVSSSGILSPYTTTTIPHGSTALIVLASSVRGGFQRQSLPSAFFPDDTVQGTYLLLYGFFEGDSFAQNVPFVAFFMI
ncbi:MAG: hypothetical protein ACLFU9_03160 [Candidatus Bathyarchaeia archaeon]